MYEWIAEGGVCRSKTKKLQKVHSEVPPNCAVYNAGQTSLGWVIKHFSCWKNSIQENRVKFVACVAQQISAPCGTPWPTFVCGEGSLLTTNWNLSDTYESHQLSTWPLIVIMLFSHCYKHLVISGSSTLHWWNETLQVTKISVFQHWWLIIFFSEANPKISSIQNLPLPLFILLEKGFRIKLVQKCRSGTFNLVLLR